MFYGYLILNHNTNKWDFIAPFIGCILNYLSLCANIYPPICLTKHQWWPHPRTSFDWPIKCTSQCIAGYFVRYLLAISENWFTNHAFIATKKGFKTCSLCDLLVPLSSLSFHIKYKTTSTRKFIYSRKLFSNKFPIQWMHSTSSNFQLQMNY